MPTPRGSGDPTQRRINSVRTLTAGPDPLIKWLGTDRYELHRHLDSAGRPFTLTRKWEPTHLRDRTIHRQVWRITDAEGNVVAEQPTLPKIVYALRDLSNDGVMIRLYFQRLGPPARSEIGRWTVLFGTTVPGEVWSVLHPVPPGKIRPVLTWHHSADPSAAFTSQEEAARALIRETSFDAVWEKATTAEAEPAF